MSATSSQHPSLPTTVLCHCLLLPHPRHTLSLSLRSSVCTSCIRRRVCCCVLLLIRAAPAYTACGDHLAEGRSQRPRERERERERERGLNCCCLLASLAESLQQVFLAARRYQSHKLVGLQLGMASEGGIYRSRLHAVVLHTSPSSAMF